MTEPASAQELFRGRHFDQEIIVLCVRWYLTFKLSSRDLVQFLRQSRTLIIRLFVSEIMAPKERSNVFDDAFRMLQRGLRQLKQEVVFTTRLRSCSNSLSPL